MSDSTNKNTVSAEEAAKNAATPADEKTEKSKKSRKAIIIIAAIVAAIIIAVIVIVAVNSGNSGDADDEDIEYIDVQANNYYTGVIEPQQTSDVNKDPDRTVSKVYVKAGDAVKKGDKLFEYDSDETATKLAKAKIEYEGIQNDIADCDNQISQYSRQRSEATDDAEVADLNSRIQEQETTKSQYQLNLKIKQVEIDNYQDSLNNSVVTSPIDGIIKQVNNGTDSSSGAFITVLMNGAYRVKGQVDEMNVRSLEAGMDVIVHSRTVADKTWKGTISKVDTSTNADDGSNSNNMGMDGSGENRASKYYFYVTLDSSEDLLLGEHVFVEPIPVDGAADGEPVDNADVDAAAADNAEN